MARNPDRQNRPANQPQPTNPGFDRAMVRWTLAVAVFTGLLFATSAIADFFIYQQGVETQRTQSIAEEQLRATIAVIGILPLHGFDVSTGKPTYGFLVQIQNQGGTRTPSEYSWASAHYFPGTIPNNFDPTKPYDPLPSTLRRPLGPNGIAFVSVGIPVTDGQAAIDGKGQVIVWGRGDYTTIYRPDTKIPFAFCFQMVPLKQKPQEGNAPATGGNTAASAVTSSPTGTTIGAAETKQGAIADVLWQAQPYHEDCNFSE